MRCVESVERLSVERSEGELVLLREEESKEERIGQMVRFTPNSEPPEEKKRRKSA